MQRLKLITHAKGAPGLRFLGLGPNFLPSRGLLKLKQLFDKHAFWAKDRNYKSLRILLSCSDVIVTLWRDQRMIGFGRATSDGIYRAVLWDIVVADDLQGKGLGSQVVKALLDSKSIKNVERIYLMTTNSASFYLQHGFQNCKTQNLLIKSKDFLKE